MKKKAKKPVLGIIIALLLIGGGVGGWFYFQSTVAPAGENTVYVQSVSDILGLGYTGINNRYSGIIEPKDVIKINPEQSLTVDVCYVKAGDSVTAGDPLFAYDVDSLNLSYEQLLIDITGLENTIIAGTEELANLDKQIERYKNKPDKLYELKLKRQEVDLSIKKSRYSLSAKEESAREMEAAIAESVIKSPVTGRIRSVKEDNGAAMYYGVAQEEDAYITIVAGTDFCVKGVVSEQTIHRLYEGMPVRITTRTADSTQYSGEIYKISSEPESNSNGYYYDSDMQNSASKYAFYVSVDSIEGLLVGQHVYLEPGKDDSTPESNVLLLPGYYLFDISESADEAYVYADKDGRIEKRLVTLGSYAAETDSYEILSGLSLQDKIAFPDESVQPGMGTATTQYQQDMPMDEGMLYDEGSMYEPAMDSIAVPVPGF